MERETRGGHGQTAGQGLGLGRKRKEEVGLLAMMSWKPCLLSKYSGKSTMHTNDYRIFFSFFFIFLKQNLYLLGSNLERNYQEFEEKMQYKNALTVTGDGVTVSWLGRSTENCKECQDSTTPPRAETELAPSTTRTNTDEVLLARA